MSIYDQADEQLLRDECQHVQQESIVTFNLNDRATFVDIIMQGSLVKF